MEKCLSIYGKAGRSEYWGVLCISMLVALVGVVLIGGVVAAIDTEITSILGGIAIILLGGAMWYLQMAVIARRCRDISINPWFSLTVLVPYIGLVPLVVFGCLPTSK